MRSIWKGAIGFGLVNIPVKMYSAVQQSELNLDMLDKKDLSRIRFRRVNESTGKEVAWENIVKGFMVDNRYVVLTEKDFQSVAAKKTNSIQIEEFINEEEVDSVYFETPYYLEPEKSGARAYALLREALEKTGKAGVATFVMRSKEILALVKPYGKVIVLNRIRFPEEIRDSKELDAPGKENIKSGELQMAVALINQLSGRFNVSRYHDTYTGELMKLIKARARGVKIKAPEMKVVHRRTTDLMDQLKASLGKVKRAS